MNRWLLAAASVFVSFAAVSAAPPVLDETGPPPLQPLPRQPAPVDPNNLADANAAKVYIINARGAYGRDFSPTPLAEILSQARDLRPDFIIVRVDFGYALGGSDAAKDCALGGPDRALDSFKTCDMALMLTDRIRDDPKWEKKPHVVMWIANALGPSCMLPWVCDKIYCTSDARHGGVGYLYGALGHAMQAGKARNLPMARAKGLAEKGGHDPRIITAMCRDDFILSVSFVGGKPEYHEDLTGDLILTDGGNEENGRQDRMEDVVRYRGNDVLTLDAAKALMLGVSKGTANALGDLLQQLGIARNYKILDGAADDILVRWSREVNAAERTLAERWSEFQNTPVIGGTPDERNQLRTKRIAILNEMKPLVQKYGEAINARAMRGPLEPAGYDALIEQTKQQILADKPAQGR